MSRMKHAVDCLARSTSPFMDLVPALSGYVVAKRVFMDAEAELSDDDRNTASLFFEIMLEILDEKFQAAYEGLDIRVAEVIKAANEDDLPTDWDADS
jgi:hypothetical protein